MNIPSRITAAAVAAALIGAGLVPVGPGHPAAAGTSPANGTVNATGLVNPLHVELSLPRRNVRAGQRVVVSATIRNLGTSPIHGVIAHLHSS